MAVVGPPVGRTGLMQHPDPPVGYPMEHPGLSMIRGSPTPATASDDTMIPSKTFEEAVEDIFWYMDAEISTQNIELSPSDGARQRRLIDLVNPYTYDQFTPLQRIRIVTSTQSPPTDEIGEEGVPMHVVLPASNGNVTRYYYAKVIPVKSNLYTLESQPTEDKPEAALKSFREVLMNLSLFPTVAASLVQGKLPVVAPMYNWFFTSIGPRDQQFIKQFSPEWTPFVFKTFYGSPMIDKLLSMFSSDLKTLRLIKDKSDQVSRDTRNAIYERYRQADNQSTSSKEKEKHAIDRIARFKQSVEGNYANIVDEKARDELGKTFYRFFKKTYLQNAPVRALVLIAESVGDISLKKAYSKHGYAFPFPRFLGMHNIPIDHKPYWSKKEQAMLKDFKNMPRKDVEKRYGIVFSRRPFAALMMHVLAIGNQLASLNVVHGDFHSGNMIAIPVQGRSGETLEQLGKRDVPMVAPGWKWNAAYNDLGFPMERNNRQAANFASAPKLQYNDLPLYVNMAPFSKDRQLPFPYNVGWPTTTDRQNPGQYLQFTLIDLGFSYRHPDLIGRGLRVLTPVDPGFAGLNVNEQRKYQRNKNMIEKMWNGNLLINKRIYPFRYHPWYDTFRLGMYMAFHVINAVDYPPKREMPGGPLVPVVLSIPGRSRGNTMLELIVRMMTTPYWLDGDSHEKGASFWQSRNQRGELYNGVGPAWTVAGYYAGLVNSLYNDNEEFMVSSRFSIEFVTFALHLTELPLSWKRHARALADTKENDPFLRCHSAINLMRHFLLVIVDIYRTFEVKKNDFRFRRTGYPARRAGSVHTVQSLFENQTYMRIVRQARTIVNQLFTESLSKLIHNGGTLENYKSPASIINDRRLWSVMI